jgi:hypothetical protein
LRQDDTVTDPPLKRRHEVAIMTSARRETQYITEWLLYHRSIGFDHVYLYCDDEDPVPLYGAVLPFVQSVPAFVTFIHFPYQGPQFYIYRHFLAHQKHKATWIAFLDIDEFLRLTGVDDIKRYLADCPPEWDAIHINWNYFGTSGHAERPEGSVLTTYTRREPDLAMVTKTLTRSACIDVARLDRKHQIWHDWGDFLVPGSVAVNVLGDPMPRVANNPDYLADPDVQARIRAKALVNHYAFKSEHDVHTSLEQGTLSDFHDSTAWKKMLDGGGLAALFGRLNEVEDDYLANYWRRFLAGAYTLSVAPRTSGPNIAVGKQARQSSICNWSRGTTVETDAAGAVSGRITGAYQFHTERESAPWWRVDLGKPHVIKEIHLYNRVDQLQLGIRLGRFLIDCSVDDETWVAVYVHDGSAVGGADGHPLVLRPTLSATETVLCRHLRITALQSTWLHLDQVEIYGEEWRTAAPPPEPETPRLQGVTAALDELIALLGKRIDAPSG